MLEPEKVRSMIDKLLELPKYTLHSLAHDLGVHEETLRKVQGEADYELMQTKQMSLIKLYCSEYQCP